MSISMKGRSAGMSARVTNPSSKVKTKKEKKKKKIKIDISCPGVFELLAVIQKKIVVDVQRVSVCVCRGGVCRPTSTFHSADGQKAVIVHFNWTFTAAFWSSTWLEQVPSDYTL